MKKVKKVLARQKGVDVAPMWFVSAMEKFEHKFEHVVPAWFPPAMEKALENYPTKNELKEAVAPLATRKELAEAVAQLARKDEMASSFRTIIDILDECATKDDFKKLETRTHKTMMTISDHETRIIHLEGHFPPVTLGNSRR